MAGVSIRGVTKRFGALTVVDDVSIEVADGEFLVLVGPSGCGKTTTLRMVAGLEEPSAGEIWIGGRRADLLHPADRDVAMVFQSYALYPHMSVYDNLAYGLRRHGHPRADIGRRVAEAAALLRIEPLLARRPAQLSGGQRQRVALGRAIVRHPSVFLMDEPLSNLDAKLRVEMRAELLRLHAQLGVTTIYVTHDQVEAMTMGQRVAAMDGGKVRQIGPPLSLYRDPESLFIARFIGTPEINCLPGRLVAAAGGLRFDGPPFAAGLPFAPAALAGREAVLAVRPQHLWASDAAEPERLALGTAVVDVVEHHGPESFALLKAGERSLTAEVAPGATWPRGTPLQLAADPAQLMLFDPATGARLG